MKPLLLSVAALAMAAAVSAAAPDPPAVVFNHFYVVVDAESYRAIQASSFMTGQLAPFEKRTTVRNDTTYTGIYFYGRRTYFELFEPGAMGAPGASGLAFGVETPGAGERVKALWAEALGGAEAGPVTRRTEAAEVPWFELIYGKGGGAALRVWLMEYQRDFLALWYPDLTPARSIARAAVLDRYVAKIGQAARRDAFLMEDVVALTLALEPGDRDHLLGHLRALGWAIREEAGDVLVNGPDVRLRIQPATTERRGVTEVELSLQAVPAASSQQRFGAAQATVERARGVLRFGAAKTGVR
jgi:hypothetical protein